MAHEAQFLQLRFWYWALLKERKTLDDPNSYKNWKKEPITCSFSYKLHKCGLANEKYGTQAIAHSITILFVFIRELHCCYSGEKRLERREDIVRWMILDPQVQLTLRCPLAAQIVAFFFGLYGEKYTWCANAQKTPQLFAVLALCFRTSTVLLDIPCFDSGQFRCKVSAAFP